MKTANKTIFQSACSPSHRSGFFSGYRAGQTFFVSKNKKKLLNISLVTLTIFSLVGGMYFSSNRAQGVDFTFTQTDWIGEATPNTATHTDNQTGWTQYSQNDPVIILANDGADLQIGAQSQTANIDFNTEADYVQEDADTGTDFAGGQIQLHSALGYTVDLCTDGAKAFADKSYATNTGDKAFDNIIGKHNVGTSWYRYQTPFPGYLGYDFGIGNEKVIIKYTLANVTDRYGTMFPRDWTFEGSNDSTDGLTDGAWTVLDTRSGESAALAEIKSYEFSNSSAYRWYRWNITESNYGSVNNLQISEAEMIGLDDVYSTTPKYVTTSDTSHLDTSTYAHITGAAVNQTTPANTDIKHLVSFDNRITWKYWNGASWQAAILADINTYGISKTTLEGLTQAQWESAEGFISGITTKLDFASSLSTSDINVTPSLDNIQISYSPQVSGNYDLISSPYDTTVTGASLAGLQWSETLQPNTDIRFQLRTSADGITWGPWCGPDAGVGCDSDAYFTDPTGGSETIDDTQKDHLNDRYFQYKATLSSSDGLNTPTLSSVTVSYATINAPAVTTVSIANLNSITATGNANLTATGGENPERFIQYSIVSN
ncbi:MAG: hypothetical protein WC120_05795, partial [Parcubacteria group bacterium]